MTRKLEYSQLAKLYRYLFSEDDGEPRLIGTDPETGAFYRWINRPGGWEQREPWPSGSANTEPLLPKQGTYSGWPGAIPITRSPGRPRREVSEEDRLVKVTFSLRRAELIRVMELAARQRQTVGEFIATLARAHLATHPVSEIAA